MNSVEASDVEFMNSAATPSGGFGEGRCVFKVNKDMHFEIVHINSECCRLFGTEKERLESRDYRLDELIHPEDKSAVFQAIGSAMATKKPIDLVMRVITKKEIFTRCRFIAQINRYDENGCPVFHSELEDVTVPAEKIS